MKTYRNNLINSEISSSPSFHEVIVKFNNIRIPLLFDTGYDQNFMSTKICQNLNLSSELAETTRVTLGNWGRETLSVNEISVNVSFGDDSQNHKVVFRIEVPTRVRRYRFLRLKFSCLFFLCHDFMGFRENSFL